ncbi:histidine kinase [Nostoc sp. DSM 114161]|jgi:PAS domain S-box-containing protein|uniref:PAS domain-containing protein n=1 Tax=Nostoc sp. DSM 114161 TaxID=3440143 RepID=UPI004045C729
MHDFVINLFSGGSFIPHGHCYLWKPGLVWLHIISDAIIALAYYSIPLALFYFVRKREDLPFSWIFLLFAAFIVFCGTTHIAEIWTLWHPTYWLSGILKATTAMVSLFTAIELVPLVPQALALPSPLQLKEANKALSAQIEERLAVENQLRRLQEELEQRVEARTAELVEVNQQLQQEIDERHRVEAALRTSRERLVLAQQVGKIGTCEWKFQTGELIWTEEMEALFGLAPGSFEGSYEHWLKRLHPDDRSKAHLAAQRTVTQGADFDTQWRIILPDGRIRWIAAKAKIFADEGQANRLIGVNMDITEYKEVQQELQQTLQTLSTLIQASPLPIVVVETDTTVKLWNAAAEQLFGWSEAELLGRQLPIVPEEKLQEFDQLREAVTKGEVFFGVETYRCKRDGSNVFLNISVAPLYDECGNVNAILLILQDITQRKQAQAALQDSEERLRLALVAGNQGLYDLNLQTGAAIVNPEYAQMLGYEPDEFQETNAKLRDRLHLDDAAAVSQAYDDCMAGKLDEYRVEFRQRTQAGDWKWILSVGKIVSWDSEGKPLRMLGTHTDISDRKRAEAEREQLLLREQAAREQAEAANRIKDEFLAILSHELRTPLNPILGWAKLLRNSNLDEQKTAYALETIERNAQLQTQLIGDLLDVSRILQGKLSFDIAPVNLETTILAAIDTVRLAAQAKSIDLQFSIIDLGLENPDISSNSKQCSNLKSEIQNHKFQVAGDTARLQQIVWNLLSNAVKFSDVGGSVEIRLERVATQAQIVVSDTGRGINPEFLPYIFDYFRQADAATTRKFGGLGLGLAIVRHLTELHGGMVTAHSLGEGHGATFTVRIPLIKTALADNQLNSDSSLDVSAALSLADMQILMVDDDADTRDYISFLLEQAGAKVTLAASAHEALQLLIQSPPDILVSDVGMPDMDGYMLMRQVRNLPPERGGNIKAIALTAYAGEMNRQLAIAAGFGKHIAKPVVPQELITAIVELAKG